MVVEKTGAESPLWNLFTSVRARSAVTATGGDHCAVPHCAQLLVGTVLLWLTRLLSPLPTCVLSTTIIVAFIDLMADITAPRRLYKINHSGRRRLPRRRAAHDAHRRAQTRSCG